MKRYMIALVLAVVAILGLQVAVPARAEAAVRTYGPTYVDFQANWTWSAPLNSARSWLEPYTHRSYTVRGACRSGYKCIIIRECSMYSGYAALTTFPYYATQVYDGRSRVKICLNPTRRSYSDYNQAKILRHELAHAHGIWDHVGIWGNVVYPSVYGTGTGTTSGQRSRLSYN